MKKYITIMLIFLLIFQNITIQAMDDMFMSEVMLDNFSTPEMNLQFMNTDNGLTLEHTFFQALEGASNASQDSLEAVQSSMNEHSTSSVDMPTAGQDFFTTDVSETPLNSDQMDELSEETLDMANDALELLENTQEQYAEVIGDIYTDMNPGDDFLPDEEIPEAEDEEDIDKEEKDDEDLDSEDGFLPLSIDFLLPEIYADDTIKTETNSSITEKSDSEEKTIEDTTSEDTNNSTSNQNLENTENIENENITKNTKSNDDVKENNTKNSNPLSLENNSVNYYIRTDGLSYKIDTSDSYIKYMLSLIANQKITVSLIVSTNTTTLSISYMSILEELPDKIVEKYNDFCIEELKKELPYGVFFLKDEYYYFTDVRTNEVAIAKTDNSILQILIPLITDKGIKVCIKYELLSDGVIYINEIILTEDLPEDIANEYKKQYSEHTRTTLYNFDGLITIIEDIYSIQTDYGNFKLYSEHNQIIQAIINNCNTKKTVRVHGYLDPDTNVINVIQIDY